MGIIKVFGGNDGMVDKEVSDEMAALINLFDETYKYAYDRYDNVDFYKVSLVLGELLIKQHHPLVSEFVKAREDFIMSDREVAAFGYAVAELGMV